MIVSGLSLRRKDRDKQVLDFMRRQARPVVLAEVVAEIRLSECRAREVMTLLAEEGLIRRQFRGRKGSGHGGGRMPTLFELA